MITTSTTSPESLIIVYPPIKLFPQESEKVTNGGLMYPDPPDIKFTPIDLPILSTTTSPSAPKPPPPNIDTFGGPQSNNPGSH